MQKLARSAERALLRMFFVCLPHLGKVFFFVHRHLSALNLF
jgi:hypothetical protein